MKIKRKTLDRIKKWTLGVGVIFLVSSLVYFYFATELFMVTRYQLEGVPLNYTEQIEKKIQNSLSEKRFKIFPRNRIFTISEARVRSVVSEVLPDTKGVSVRIRGLHTLVVEVESFTPLFKINETQAVTVDGFVYTALTSLEQYPLLITASTTEMVTIKGATFTKVVGLDKKDLASYSLLVQKINSIIFIVSKIMIDEFGDVTFYDERGVSMIKFSRFSDVEKVWSTLLSAIDTEPLRLKLIKHKNELLYIDVRFGNKVFYKFTNDEKTVIIQSHATTSYATTTFSN